MEGFSLSSVAVRLERFTFAEPIQQSLFESASFVEKLVAPAEEFGFFKQPLDSFIKEHCAIHGAFSETVQTLLQTVCRIAI